MHLLVRATMLVASELCPLLCSVRPLRVHSVFCAAMLPLSALSLLVRAVILPLRALRLSVHVATLLAHALCLLVRATLLPLRALLPLAHAVKLSALALRLLLRATMLPRPGRTLHLSVRANFVLGRFWISCWCILYYI
jgi:hypothetical protein